MSSFKLQLSEDEKEIFAEIFINSDAYKVIYKILDQLTALQEKDALSRVQDGSDKSKNELACVMIELQGMNKLVRNIKALKETLRKGRE